MKKNDRHKEIDKELLRLMDANPFYPNVRIWRSRLRLGKLSADKKAEIIELLDKNKIVKYTVHNK